MAKQQTNADKLLTSVLMDSKLIEFGGYNPSDIETIEEALISENICVQAVAKIIDGKEGNRSDKEIYKEVNGFLKYNI